jgi:hypothetical protein
VKPVEVTAAGDALTLDELATLVQRARMAGMPGDTVVWTWPRMTGGGFVLRKVAVGSDGPPAPPEAAGEGPTPP